MTAFLEKDPNPITDQINAGAYVFRRCVLESIPAGRPVSVERETFPQLLAAGAKVIDAGRGYGRACMAGAMAATAPAIAFLDGDGADRGDLLGDDAQAAGQDRTPHERRDLPGAIAHGLEGAGGARTPSG